MEPYSGKDTGLSAYLNRVLSKLEASINQILFVPNNTPCFAVQSGEATTVGNVVHHTSVVFDTHNAMDITTGKYTVPRSGNYFFRYSQLVSVDGEYRIYIRKNGAAVPGLGFVYVRTGDWMMLIAEGHVQINKDEYVDIYLGTAPGALYNDANFGSFSGHMVGVTI
jgi:hypothetical protein